MGEPAKMGCWLSLQIHLLSIRRRMIIELTLMGCYASENGLDFGGRFHFVRS